MEQTTHMSTLNTPEQTELIRVHKNDNDFVFLISNLINDNISFKNKILYIDRFKLTLEEASILNVVAKETNYKVFGMEVLDISKEKEFVEYIAKNKFNNLKNVSYFKNAKEKDLELLVISTILYFKKNFILLTTNERFRLNCGTGDIHDDFIKHFKNMFVEHNPERYKSILLDDKFTMCVNLGEKSVYEEDKIFLCMENNTLLENLDRVFYNNTLHILPTYSYIYFYETKKKAKSTNNTTIGFFSD